MTENTVRKILRAKAARAGSQVKLASQIGCSAVYVSDVLRGRISPGPLILRYLGLEVKRNIVYSKVNGKGE